MGLGGLDGLKGGFGMTVGSLWGRCGVTLRHFGVTLGHAGAAMGQLLGDIGYLGVTLGYFEVYISILFQVNIS